MVFRFSLRNSEVLRDLAAVSYVVLDYATMHESCDPRGRFQAVGFSLRVPFSLTLIANLNSKVMARIMQIRTYEAKRQVSFIRHTSRLMWAASTPPSFTMYRNDVLTPTL
jgi:tRNA A37 N6-isopentenylltransferase MiaA